VFEDARSGNVAVFGDLSDEDGWYVGFFGGFGNDGGAGFHLIDGSSFAICVLCPDTLNRINDDEGG
jgi:hypothetical protein